MVCYGFFWSGQLGRDQSDGRRVKMFKLKLSHGQATFRDKVIVSD